MSATFTTRWRLLRSYRTGSWNALEQLLDQDGRSDWIGAQLQPPRTCAREPVCHRRDGIGKELESGFQIGGQMGDYFLRVGRQQFRSTTSALDQANARATRQWPVCRHAALAQIDGDLALAIRHERRRAGIQL